MKIINEPHIKFVTDRNVILTKKFDVDFKIGKDRYYFSIPKGFISDGCTIPDFLWVFPFYFVPFEGKTLPGAIVHDYLYSHDITNKKFADFAFFELLKKYKVNKFKRFVYWVAVSLFGRGNFK